MSRDLSQVDYVYCWVDGVHFTVRLGDDDRLCVLVMVGVRTDGTKELVAISDGYRESTESWAELLRADEWTLTVEHMKDEDEEAP